CTMRAPATCSERLERCADSMRSFRVGSPNTFHHAESAPGAALVAALESSIQCSATWLSGRLKSGPTLHALRQASTTSAAPRWAVSLEPLLLRGMSDAAPRYFVWPDRSRIR